MLQSRTGAASRTAVLLASVAWTSCAFAQGPAQGTPDRNTGGELTEIVVTAQRRAESANTVPVSISAFSGETLTKFGANDVAAIARLVPGFSTGVSSRGTPIYTLRGIGFNSFTMSNTSPVGIYSDEVSLAYPIMSKLVAFDLQRVEVLKGPQGTLYGRNTTGGLVNFISASPTDTPEASFTVGAANYLGYTASGFASGPLSPTLNGRVAFKVDGRERGWQKSVTRPGDRLGEMHQMAVRGILDWTPSSNLKSRLTATHWEDDSDTLAGQAIIYDPVAPAFAIPAVQNSVLTHPKVSQADWTSPNQPGQLNANSPVRPRYGGHSVMSGVSLRNDIAINDAMDLVTLTSYNHLKRNDVASADGVAYEISTNNLFGSIKSFAQEVRLSGDYGPLRVLVGGYYGRDKISDNLQSFNSQSSIIGLLRFVATLAPGSYTPEEIADGFRTFGITSDVKDTTKSIYGNADYRFSDRLKVSGGLRYTDEKMRYVGCSHDIGGNILPIWNTALGLLTGTRPNIQEGGCITFNNELTGPAGLIHNRLHEKNLAIRASVDWTPARDTLFYVSFSRGFKAGAFPLTSANVASQVDPAKQEEVFAYEAGTKISAFDRRVQLNVAGYYYDYRDKQLFGRVPDVVFTTLQKLVNVPKSRAYGVEADLTWQATPELLLNLSGNYLNTKVQEYVGFDASAAPRNFKGLSFPFAPRWTSRAAASYTTLLSSGLSLQLAANASYQSKTKAVFENDPILRIRGYVVTDGSLSLIGNDDQWRLSLWGRNLFNTYYWTNVDSPQDVFVRYPGMARTFGLSATFNIR